MQGNFHGKGNPVILYDASQSYKFASSDGPGYLLPGRAQRAGGYPSPEICSCETLQVPITSCGLRPPGQQVVTSAKVVLLKCCHPEQRRAGEFLSPPICSSRRRRTQLKSKARQAATDDEEKADLPPVRRREMPMPDGIFRRHREINFTVSLRSFGSDKVTPPVKTCSSSPSAQDDEFLKSDFRRGLKLSGPPKCPGAYSAAFGNDDLRRTHQQIRPRFPARLCAIGFSPTHRSSAGNEAGW